MFMYGSIHTIYIYLLPTVGIVCIFANEGRQKTDTGEREMRTKQEKKTPTAATVEE